MTPLEFASNAHKGQIRKFTGEPFINHPCRVANLVRTYTNNQDLIDSSFLHDTIEDTNVTYSDICDSFGGVVAEIVWELTKQYTKENYPDLNREQRHSKELDRLKESSWSAKLIKLCDIYDNCSDFARNDDTWSEDHYYRLEKLEAIKVIGYVCPQLSENILRILNTFD